MAQCTVTAKKLNIRRIIPASLPDSDNIIGVANEGFTFEGVEVDATTVSDPNLAKWYRDRDGYYYWGGGLLVKDKKQIDIQSDKENDFQKSVNQNFDGTILKGTIDYNDLLNLKSEYRKSQGLGITIALLDTGVSPLPVLMDSLLNNQVDFTNSKYKYDDKKGHGTFLSGLICGYSNRIETINGIAPKCKIANIKVIKDNGTAVGDYLKSGLKRVTEDFINCIINMSLDITVQEYQQLADTNIFDILSEKNVCVAAAGENEQLLINNGIYSPAVSDKVIAVGTIDIHFFRNTPSPNFDPRLDYIIPQFDLVSYGIDSGYLTQPGVSSMACAIVSAIIALVFSKKGANQLSVQNARDELDLLATPYKNLNDINTLKLIKP